MAASSLGVPASTAESTLILRSFEYGFMPGGYHTWIDTYGCRCDDEEFERGLEAASIEGLSSLSERLGQEELRLRRVYGEARGPGSGGS